MIVSKDNYREIKRIGRAFDIVKDDTADICIALGGDGTFMKAAERFNGPILPIRGSEKGSRGFYADFGIEKMGKVIALLKKGRYRIEPLSKKIMVSYRGRSYYAINEATLKSEAEEVYFSIYRKTGKRRSRIYPFVMAGDGMLVTSVVGSTAYNKSANGPVLLTPKAMCMTFLNPDGPYKNPIVFDSGFEITIVIEKYEGVLKSDNKRIAVLKPGDSFSIRMSDSDLRIVRFPGLEEPLHKKLKRLIMSKAVEHL